MNNVSITANKPNKRNKTDFILYAQEFPPLYSHVNTNKVLKFFSMLGLKVLIKKINQNTYTRKYGTVLVSRKHLKNFAPN